MFGADYNFTSFVFDMLFVILLFVYFICSVYFYSQAVFAFQMTDIGATEFGGYVFPDWADAIGWLIGASTLMPFIGFLLYRLIKGPVSVEQYKKNSGNCYCTYLVILGEIY